ncbi:3-hydroxyacyl-CoA dehydrogenase NAD-binding domain-containing protein [Nocardioides insulae]|uniref:3-hydroxyacyl-CoA dehydrogenase NAD-binding domain-containing protein n=1 Tax=Nocardioides insulae TaxID=394734 RepID=UPI000491D4D1|nr:3-hydroxyacyl-CoA dehydrogenase NAD-binding domain-containing protein [Nocardioides insulae]
MTSPTAARIASTLIYPYLNHAVRMLESGYATAADIDAAMRFGCGYPAGPLAVLDETGPAGVRGALAQRFAETGDPLHRPAALLDRVADEASTVASAAPAAVTGDPVLKHRIERVGVVGTGTMAAGIVEVFAKSGYDVIFVGRTQDKVDGVVTTITASLDRAIAKGRAEESTKTEVLGRLTGATAIETLDEVDLVVEAVAEQLELKTRLFLDLDRVCKPGTILATTTSSLPITELAKVTGRPQDVIGMHFFNPAPVMKLVEVVATDLTAPEVDQSVKALCASVGKVAVSCTDRAGFIVNCLLFPYLNDAIKLHESGIDMAVIDTALKEQAGLPMGPFELLDVVGADVSLAIQKELHSEFEYAGFAPAALLEEKVAAGELGRKTGRGFHDYR